MSPDAVEIAVGDASLLAVREGVGGWRGGFAGDPPGQVVPIGFSCHLLRVGAACVLIDAGLGSLDLPWARRFTSSLAGFTPGTPLAAALAARAIAPEDVSHVVLTHAHLDHVAGAVVCSPDGALSPRFPRAAHLLHARDRVTARYDGRRDPDVETWLDVLRARANLTLVDRDAQVVDGVRLAHAPGESPGHMVVWIERRGDAAVHLGDLVHGRDELADPARVPAGRDPAALRASRARVLGDAARRGAVVTCSHAPDEPFGTLRPLGDGFAWSAARSRPPRPRSG